MGSTTYSTCPTVLFLLIFFVHCYSIGCGIGYGYLHRIPLRDEANRPKEAAVIKPAADGFSEVIKCAQTAQCVIYTREIVLQNGEV